MNQIGRLGMMNPIMAVLITFSLLSFGCSSGSNRPRGKQCSADYNPIPTELSGEGIQKISLKTEENQISVGSYQFESADFFLNDEFHQTKVHIKVNQDKKTGEPVTANVCVRGVNLDRPFSTSELGMKEMTIGTNKKIDYTFLQLEMNFDGVLLHSKVVDPSKTTINKPSNPEELYQQKGDTFSFYQMADKVHYELRSVNHSDSQSQFLSIRYVFTPNINK